MRALQQRAVCHAVQAQKLVTEIEHPSYSSDLAPNNFCFLKQSLPFFFFTEHHAMKAYWGIEV